VDAGVVRLVGTVINAGTRTRAVALATAMDGVVFVDDRIRESTSLEEQLDPTWDRLRELGFGAVAKLPLIAVALLIIALAAWLGSLLSRWRGPSFLHTRNPFLQGLIRRFVQGLVVIIGIILALDLLDATALVGAVAGTAGLAGLALGFAFKDIVENYLAGTLLAMRQPFAKNDHIVVDTFEGKVVRLTPRETILMSIQGNHIRIPNATIFRNPMINYTRNPLRRFEFDYGVGVADDLAAAREVAESTLKAMEGVLEDPPPETHVIAIGDSSVTLRSMAWVDQREAEFLRVRSEAIRLVKTQLEDAGLTLPSPEFVIRMQPDVAARASTVTAPVRPAPTVQADVSVDRAVDEQIEVERRVSDEDDLLDEEPPRS
jgi:small-conductance mechanosensitive channel